MSNYSVWPTPGVYMGTQCGIVMYVTSVKRYSCERGNTECYSLQAEV